MAERPRAGGATPGVEGEDAGLTGAMAGIPGEEPGARAGGTGRTGAIAGIEGDDAGRGGGRPATRGATGCGGAGLMEGSPGVTVGVAGRASGRPVAGCDGGLPPRLSGGFAMPASYLLRQRATAGRLWFASVTPWFSAMER